MSKKVIIIGPAYPLRGGLATYNERLARAFEAQGFDVVLLSFKLQYPTFLFPGKTQYSDTPAPNLKIDSAINSINPFNWIKVGMRYKKINADLVIFRYWMPFMAPAFGTIARLIALNKKTKITAITDNIVPHERRFGDTLLTRYFLKPIGSFVAMSRKVLADIDLFDHKKSKAFIPHPLYDDFGPAMPMPDAKNILGLDPKFNYILFFGFIRKYKGLQLLIESFAAMDYKKYKCKLLIAGEFYEDSKPYLDLIAHYKLQEHVILHTDFIPNKKVPYYFCASDFVAQTYLSATQSGVTQIAYFYHKPMLITDVGGLAELVPHQKVGLVVKVDKDEIAKGLETMYKNNNLQNFEKAVATESLKFSWEMLVNKILNLNNINIFETNK